MIDVQHKHIVVIGAARSGVAVASLLNRLGAQVYVTDSGTIADEVRERLVREEISFEERGHTHEAECGEFAVVSPGVPTQAPLVQYYLKNNKKVFSELEAASWFNKSPMVGVTGSNGKTTVTNWIQHTFKTAKKSSFAAGNIGMAFSDRIELTDQNTWAILEVSSFQLDHIDSFRPNISLILNITPDHLDRYDNSFEKYYKAKFRITDNQTSKDWFIYNFDDPVIKQHVDYLKQSKDHPRLLAFSAEREVPEGIFIRDRDIVFKINNNEENLMPVEEVSLRGLHNLNNGLATALAARAAEIKNDTIRESLRTFEGVEHRLELVREVDGVKYINDSKATNVNAVWYALDSFNSPLILIMGGRDKGNDYSELIPRIREKVHSIIAIGESRDKIEQQLSAAVPHFEKAGSLAEAVRLSKRRAKRGEIVLLSPACSSFDMFRNYEHRGNEFKKEVNSL